MTPKDKKEYDRLTKAGRALLAQASEIEYTYKSTEEATYVGRYFKTQNSFGEGHMIRGRKARPWWLYMKVLHREADGYGLTTWTFETRADGEVGMKPARCDSLMYIQSYTEITAKEFVKAWRELIGNLNAIGLT